MIIIDDIVIAPERADAVLEGIKIAAKCARERGSGPCARCAEAALEATGAETACTCDADGAQCGSCRRLIMVCRLGEALLSLDTESPSAHTLRTIEALVAAAESEHADIASVVNVARVALARLRRHYRLALLRRVREGHARSTGPQTRRRSQRGSPPPRPRHVISLHSAPRAPGALASA